MMKALLQSQFSVILWHERYYTQSAFSSILRRYADAFGPLALCTPLRRSDSIDIQIMDDVTKSISSVVSVSRNESFFGLRNREMRRAIAASDLVIVRCHSFVAFRASDMARKLGKPILAEAMADPWDGFWNHGILGKLIAPYMYFKMRHVMWHADYALYVTQKFLQKRYPCKSPSIGASNVLYPPPGQDVLAKRLLRISGGKPKTLVLMTCAAVNVRHKGQRFVIRALPSLQNMGIHAIYYCVGAGDQTYLQRVAEKNGVGNQVIFTGKIPHNRVFEMLDQCDIYIQPSLQEGLPRALIEAMSRGCPCIGAKTAGIPELLPDECIVPQKSVQEIALCIQYMLDDGLEKYASQNFEEAQLYKPDVLDARRNRYFRRIREHVEQTRYEHTNK